MIKQQPYRLSFVLFTVSFCSSFSFFISQELQSQESSDLKQAKLPKKVKHSTAQIKKWITQLVDKKFKTRTIAHDNLLKVGNGAIEELKKYVVHENQELQHRVRTILVHLAGHGDEATYKLVKKILQPVISSQQLAEIECAHSVRIIKQWEQEDEVCIYQNQSDDIIQILFIESFNRILTERELSLVKPLKSLEALCICGTKVSAAGQLYLKEFTTLQELILMKNQLTKFPIAISKLTNLKELHIWNNQITKLPPELFNLANLTELTVIDNQLSELPPEIGKLKKMTELNLKENNLERLPVEIGNLTKLKVLGIHGNKLTKLPAEFFKLVNLTELDLSKNQLTKLSSSIGRLKKLEKLLLNENKLTFLPPEIGKLTNLEQLYLSGNKLTKLPHELSMLTNLREIDLRGNPITDDDLKHLKLIQEYGDLNLSNTNVTKRGVASLKKLYPTWSISSDF